MPQTFVVDQAATFSAVAFLEANPKMVFGKQGEQDMTADGTPKWEVQLVAGFKQFGRSSHEVIKVGVSSHSFPGEGLAPYTPVQVVGFTVGVTPPEVRKDSQGREKLVGGSTWFRAEEIRPLTATAPVPSARKAEAKAAA